MCVWMCDKDVVTECVCTFLICILIKFPSKSVALERSYKLFVVNDNKIHSIIHSWM